MRRLRYILMLILFSFVMQSSASFASKHLCQNPELYLLSKDEVNIANSDFYCWEIRYLKQYHKLLSTSMASYYNFYSKELNKENIEYLRSLGITPEKYDYLRKYFINEGNIEPSEFNNTIKTAITSAKKYLGNNTEYTYGKPIFPLNSLIPTEQILSTAVSTASFGFDFNTILPYPLRSPSMYDNFLIIFGQNCVPSNGKMNSVINKYPDSLQPIGVVGKYFVNAFGEVSLELYQTKESRFFPKYEVRISGKNESLGSWDAKLCGVTDFNQTLKRAFSCTPCTMFEIAFNTVSRIGFVLYDKLSRFAIELMVVLFSLWSLIMFFDNAIKKQDGYAYIKTFLTKIVWVFFVGAFLSVSIKDQNNIVNYTIRPITDFMVDYNKVMTKAIDFTHPEWTCKYATRDLKDNKYLFSKDVKQDIVCTIERVADFNNLNILIGISEVVQGFKQIINFKVSNGIIKVLLGIIIAGIFFIFNLTVPYYFIESLFNIAIVVFLFPLFLMGYAFDKGKSFVKNGFNTFLSAISQIIALSIMCSVISLLMFYISSIDFYGIQKAMETNNSQEIASSMLLFYSFNTNRLLEIIYTGIICWWLLNKTLQFANAFGADRESLPSTFGKFMSNAIKTATSVTVDYKFMKVKTGALATKLKNQKDKENKEIKKTKESTSEVLKRFSGDES